MNVRELLREAVEKYSQPRMLHGTETLRLACAVCFIDEGVAAHSDPAWPTGLRDLYSACSKAELFIDVDYGQWGLRILSPEACDELAGQIEGMMPDDVRDEDHLIGEFLGDSEFLFLTTGGPDAGSLHVSIPMYSRAQWYRVGDSIEEFLRLYIDNQGQKFWE